MKQIPDSLWEAMETLACNWADPSKEAPDATVQWAINELSDDGYEFLFSDTRRVVAEFNKFKSMQ